MSEVIGDRPDDKETNEHSTIGRILNSNTVTTALTCALFMVIFAVCFRPNSDSGGGDGYYPTTNLEKKLAKMEQRIDALSKALKEADERYVNSASVEKDKSAPQQLVYFNANMMPHKTITEGNVFIFETVTENIGASYDSHTGIFRAPVPGLYFISVTVASEKKGKNVHPVLIKNGVEIGRTFAGTHASEWPASGSVSKLTYLETNDQVYVKEIGLSGYVANVYGNSFTSFSGGLLIKGQ